MSLPSEAQNRRRFPRIPSIHDGVMQLPRGYGPDPSRPASVACVVTSLSPDGIGFALRESEGVSLAAGILVVLSFDLDDEPISLPAMLVRLGGAVEISDVGATLRLEMADSKTRTRYVEWIAAALAPSGRAEPGPTAVGHASVSVHKSALLQAAAMARRRRLGRDD